MRRGAWLVLILAGLAAAHAQANDEATRQVLVTFADPGLSNASRAGPVRPGYVRRSATYLVSMNVRRAADRIAEDLHLTIVDEWPIVPLRVHCLVYAVGPDASVDDVIARLRARSEVESAQRMNAFEVLGTPAGADPYQSLQRNHDSLELTQAHAWSLGDGSTVAIIDTGADFRHPELATQIDEHVDFVNKRDQDFAADAHGTAVAGIIAAASDNGIGMIGVAPLARLSLLKACWYADDGATAVCNSFTLAKALAHVIETAPQVINLSLGGPPDALLTRLVRAALERGSVVVAADPRRAEPGFPADVPGVIVVASPEESDSVRVPVLAPGKEILVPTPGGGFDYASGSSLAAAHVSGIAALLVASRPGLTGTNVEQLLVASRPDERHLVNACRALANLLGRSGCRDDTTAHNHPTHESERGGDAQDQL